MTGFTFPLFMSSYMVVRSSLFGLARNVTAFWRMNRDNTSAAIKRDKRPIIPRPLKSPTMTHIPSAFNARLHSDNE